MKITDLMIGDWVQYNDQPVKVHALNVSDGYVIMEDQVSVELTKDTCMGIDAKRLEPIPLNQDFLEKNGFIINKTTEMGYKHYQVEEPEYIEVEDYHGYYELTIHDYYEIAYHKHIEYVHQFQHALKSCEIVFYDSEENIKEIVI